MPCDNDPFIFSDENSTEDIDAHDIENYAYANMSDAHRKLSICGMDNLKDAVCSKNNANAPMYRNAHAVARIYLKKKAGCTGWLLGSHGNLLVTNNHCIPSESVASSAIVHFHAQAEECGNSECDKFMTCLDSRFIIHGTQLIARSKKYDYAIVKLHSTQDLNKLFGGLKMRATGANVQETIYVPQHPRGYGKKIVHETNIQEPARIAKRSVFAKAGLYHNADTEGGSSGSPIISQTDHLVIGLHHKGGCGQTWKKNRSVDMQYIIQDLKHKKFTFPEDSIHSV